MFDFKEFFKGLGLAAAGGSAAAVAGTLNNPEADYSTLGALAVGGGILSAAGYFLQSPLFRTAATPPIVPQVAAPAKPAAKKKRKKTT